MLARWQAVFWQAVFWQAAQGLGRRVLAGVSLLGRHMRQKHVGTLAGGIRQAAQGLGRRVLAGIWQARGGILAGGASILADGGN